MLTQDNAVSITDLKRNTRAIIQKTQQETGPLYLMDRSSPVGVILPLEEYNTLVQTVEDLVDAHQLGNTDLTGGTSLEAYDLKRSSRHAN